MTHHTSSNFWTCYYTLPRGIRNQADKNFDLLKGNPRHPSLHFKKIGKYWSVRASQEYRALGMDVDDGILWFWIGTHPEYDRLIARQRKR
jgi:hypothetical protein